MPSIASLPIQHPSWTYLTLAPILALGALSPTPSLPPLVLLLAILRLHAGTIVPRRNWSGGAKQIILITLSIAIAHAGSSLHALSTPYISLFVLALISTVTTVIAASAVALGYYLERAFRTSWALATVFPATWATAWALVEYCSPIGQLATWSPVVQVGGYAWLRHVGGQVAINWVVAAWAVVFADAAGKWIVGSSDEEVIVTAAPHLISVAEDDLPAVEVTPPTPNANGTTATSYEPSRSPSSTHLLTGLLLALAVPSYFTSDLPTHVAARNVTPFGVACALPFPMRNGRPLGPPGLDDYIAESRTLQSSAQIVLWPESAVHFQSRNEREDAFNKTQQRMNRGVYYGIGFDEIVHEDSADGVWRAGMRRNGLVLLSSEGVVFEYYKRHLVPIAESFSMTPSNERPTMFTMQLKAPRGWSAPSWAPGPNYTRPVDFTASICLDFSTSSSFAGLPSRPALILAPARTWHTSIGLAMWEQAKARAEEQGSMVLWCDGGGGGVSGVAGKGMHAFRQVGPGSWSQTVSIPWPFDQRRTVFSVVGTSTALGVVWALAGLFWMAGVVRSTFNDRDHGAGRATVRIVRSIRAAVEYVSRRDRRGETEPLL
ncbi:hypothetical protein BD309DRAFT_231754 [Dichomitus squalens]|nr:hypothetical protein BD309DRAFT_231754 [Dichomitus squalens]